MSYRRFKVLIVLPSLDGGGIDRIMYGYAKELVGSIDIDFLVFSEDTGILEEELKSLNCRIFHSPSLRKGVWNSFTYQLKIMRLYNYDIVHVNSYAGTVSLLCALAAGIQGRICHAHTKLPEVNLLKKTFVRSTIMIDRLLANGLYACSNQVAEWTWRVFGRVSKKVTVIPNAIELEKYKYSRDLRNKTRSALNIGASTFVVGQVARFSEEKNHVFAIMVFSALIKKRPNSKFLLVGKGPSESFIREKIREAGLQNNIMFLGNRKDVPELLCAMDAFILPSLYEGLPVTLIEAQANDLPIICSDMVHHEVAITNHIEFVSVELPPEQWSHKLENLQIRGGKLDSQYQFLLEAGYSIQSAAKKLEVSWNSLLD